MLVTESCLTCQTEWTYDDDLLEDWDPDNDESEDPLDGIGCSEIGHLLANGPLTQWKTADPAKLMAQMHDNCPECNPKIEKVGRNQPCWCGSGSKFKMCHGL